MKVAVLQNLNNHQEYSIFQPNLGCTYRLEIDRQSAGNGEEAHCADQRDNGES